LIAKSDIRLESTFSPTPPAFKAPVRGVSVGILPCRLVRKNKNGGATRRLKNLADIFIRFDRMYERDRWTDAQTPHDGIGRAYA